MKIAVISDIHANLIALLQVLKDIEEEKCDSVFCLGDIALAGPQPRETLDLVKTQNWTFVQGNTDVMLSQYDEDVEKMLEEKFPVIANAVKDDLAYLTEEDDEFLNSLAPQVELCIEGVNILLVHGSPRKNNEDIKPDMPLVEVEEIISGTKADLIFCGHTHLPCGYQTNSKQTVVNVGSVGRPMTPNPIPCYAIVELSEGSFNIKHKFVEYNRELAANILRNRGFKGADKLADLLINPENRHV